MHSLVRSLASAFVLSACVAVTWTEPARAQDDPATQMARDRFQEGVKYYDAKQYERARAAFLQAYALKKHPAVLLNLAQSELRSGHEADAAKHFAQYLREAPEQSSERREAEKGLADAKKSVGEYSINVDAQGAEVYVDGNLEGRSPLPGPIYLAPGNHSVEARMGEQVATTSITALAGQTGSANLSLSGGGTTPAPGPTGPAAVPPAGSPPPGGPQPGGPDGSGGIGFDTGDKRKPFFDWATETPLAWVGGGLTVLGLAGGVGFAISSNTAYDDAESVRQQILSQAQKDNLSQPPCSGPVTSPTDYTAACQKYQDRVDAGDSQKTLSIVSFVVAGVAAGGTVVYYLVDSKEEASAKKQAPRGFSAGLTPVATPWGSSLHLVGSF